ncbi:MAG TPA: benzoate-CoA ligase family protein [Xanthobacteraceae bacterium]|jgi:benzoate-CoA ligase|nr:benzoate-CoA ligase family protein [Xanthobacteraceae bacterium]
MAVSPRPGSGRSPATIPREYNFALDLFDRFRGKGWLPRVAYIDQRGQWTFGQLRDRAEAFSLLLERMQVHPEERVLMCLLDSFDWPAVFLGTLAAGRVAVPVNTLLTEEDYRFILADSRARVLVVSQELYPKFENIIGSFFGLHVIVAGENPHGRQRLEDLLGGVRAFGSYRPPPTTCDDIAFWLYTSGSTGKPKAAVHVHADLRLTNDLYAASVLRLTVGDVVYSVAKLFFAYGLGNAMTFPLSAGATTVLLPDRPTPEAVTLILRRYAVTVFFAVPTFYAGFLASSVAPTAKEVRLRCCVSAGEALPAEVGRRWRARYGVDILDGLGSTEMLHIYLSNHPYDVRYGSSGKPVEGYDVRLVDDDGVVISVPGMMGELQVRGPTSAVMYWNNREQSRATFLGEWTRSGDKYLQDDAGYYVYCGRRDDMLKVGGIYVSPFEIEDALQSHEDVLEAAVVAWPDEDQLIKPKAFVVLKSAWKSGKGLVGEALVFDLQEHCKTKLAPYKYPRWIEFRAELPKTATGKIQRFKLRAEAPVK